MADRTRGPYMIVMADARGVLGRWAAPSFRDVMERFRALREDWPEPSMGFAIGNVASDSAVGDGLTSAERNEVRRETGRRAMDIAYDALLSLRAEALIAPEDPDA